MDIFHRFLNPHILLQIIKDQSFKEKLYKQTRLYQHLPSDVQERQQLLDALDYKLGNITQLLDLIRQPIHKLSQDYLQENLYSAEETYQVCVILFDMGQYEKASGIIDKITPFIVSMDKLSHLRNGFLWAQLNCHAVLALQNEQEKNKHVTICGEVIQEIVEYEGAKTFKQRADLLHIGLLLILENPVLFLELFANDTFLEVVYTIAPYGLYYITYALILNKGVGQINLSQIATQVNKIKEKYHLLLFIDELIGKFNFNGAIKYINDIKQEAQSDPLISKYSEQLVNGCLILFFSTYIRIFNNVQIKKFAEYLGVNEEESELWLVNAIRQLNINAKIEGGLIIIHKSESSSQNQQLLRQIKEMIPRNNLMNSNLQRILNIK